MLKATEIKTLIPAKGTLVLSFKATDDGKLSVIVHPKYTKTNNLNNAQEAIEKAKSPVVITATPEELDEKFMEFLSQITFRRQNMEETIKQLDAAVQEALKQAKATADQKIKNANKTSKGTAVKLAAEGGMANTTDSTGTENTTETKVETEAENDKTLSLFA